MLSGLIDRMNHVVQGGCVDAFQTAFLVGIVGTFLFEDLLGLLEGYFGGFEGMTAVLDQFPLTYHGVTFLSVPTGRVPLTVLGSTHLSSDLGKTPVQSQ